MIRLQGSTIIILILFFVLDKCSIDAAKEATSGPYKSYVAKVTTCEKPSHPYLENPPIQATFTTYNISDRIVLNCDLRIMKDTKNVKYRMKIFTWENGKYRPNHIMNDIGCNGIVLPYICSALGVKYDTEKCMFLKGQYSLTNLDANAIQHLMATKMEYGKMVWRAEVFNSKLGTFFCTEFHSVTEPL